MANVQTIHRTHSIPDQLSVASKGLAGVKARGSLGEYAYHTLRRAIHDGSFEPAQRLREATVARWLGISRTPTREAIKRLMSEGLLVSAPGYGVTVSEPSYQQLTEIYAVREYLEGLAARLAARHASDAELERIWEIHEEEKKIKNDIPLHAQINYELHKAINFASHNQYLCRVLDDANETVGILRYPSFITPKVHAIIRDEHFHIIDSIQNGKASDAERYARSHVQHSAKRRLTLAG